MVFASLLKTSGGTFIRVTSGGSGLFSTWTETGLRVPVLPAASVAVTLIWWVPTSVGVQRIEGVADGPETGLHSYGSYSVLGRIEADGIIDIRDGASYVDLTEDALQTQTYYEFWFIVDHFNSTFSQYIKGGADYAEQTLLHEDAAFRNPSLGSP